MKHYNNRRASLASYRCAIEEFAKEKSYQLSRYQEFTDLILKYIGGRVLEIGCGDGAWGRVFSENSRKLIALDLSAERITQACERAGNFNTADFILADGMVLPFKDSSFDTVCAIEVIEHLPDYAGHLKLFNEAKRVLVPGGFFIVTTPNRPVFRFYGKITKEKDPTHFSELNFFQFKRSLKAYFAEVRIYGRFGWLSPLYKFYYIRRLHKFLSKLSPLCKGLIGVCKK